MPDLITIQKDNYALKKLRRLNILLVDDNLLNIKLLSILFAQNGINLQTAENGMIAIEKIQAGHFDLVLMDVEMPVMNGYQVTMMIRRQLKNNIPVIALTASALAGEKEKCMQLGMNDLVLKSIDAELLFRAIFNLTCNSKTAGPETTPRKFAVTDKPAGKVCNMGYLVGITRGNKKMINNIVAVFFKETRKELIFLNDAIAKTNYTLIHDISHKIKSAFSILGISVLEPVFKEMEQLSLLTSPIGKIAQLTRTVNLVFNQAKAEMKVLD